MGANSSRQNSKTFKSATVSKPTCENRSSSSMVKTLVIHPNTPGWGAYFSPALPEQRCVQRGEYTCGNRSRKIVNTMTENNPMQAFVIDAVVNESNESVVNARLCGDGVVVFDTMTKRVPGSDLVKKERLGAALWGLFLKEMFHKCHTHPAHHVIKSDAVE